MSGEKIAMSTMNASRRLFLRHAGLMSAIGAAGGPLALNLSAIGTASAQNAADYKAIVCLFLFGGNTRMKANHHFLRQQHLDIARITSLRHLFPPLEDCGHTFKR